jgi:hypothetical protein
VTIPSFHLPTLQRRYLLLWWILVSAVPILYVATKIVEASRNIVFWDEFDTALDLVLRINMGADWREVLHRLFALNNEHRTVTSRLIFATSYWLTGTVNFHVIGAIGNLFLVGACATLVLAVSGWERRIRIGVVLAFLMFQLEHFESFIWSGASIDHFQVVMLGVMTIALVARGSLGTLIGAMVLGLLATFTLAHGNLVWPISALLLAYQRRWNHLIGWCGCGVAVVAAFLHGFEFNPGHQIADLSVKNVAQIARYWLALLGGPLTLGDAGFAPLPGLVLITGLGILAARGAASREPVAMFSALFAIGALALVACGRAELAGTEINSRYLVLGALAWAMLLYMLLELATEAGKPFRVLVCVVPALAAFNVSANVKFAPAAEGFIEIRDRAATSFKQYGQDGKGLWRLHPQDGHAEILLQKAHERGVYELPRVSEPASFPDAQPSTRMITYVDELLINERAVTVGGWAMLPGEVSKRGQVYIMLRSPAAVHYYSALTLQRPDVAKAYNEPKWRLCGFRAVIGRPRLPTGDFEVGVLIDNDDGGEFKMTAHRLHLSTDKAVSTSTAP